MVIVCREWYKLRYSSIQKKTKVILLFGLIPIYTKVTYYE